MEGRSGYYYCMARRMPEDPDMASRIGRIMLRFRPIAPKPAAAVPVSCATTVKMLEAAAGRRRRRRRGKRCSTTNDDDDNNGKRGKKSKAAGTATSSPCSSSSSAGSERTDLLTLPLMSEMPKRWEEGSPSLAAVVVPRARKAVGSVVTVEWVGEAYGDEEGRWLMVGLAEGEARRRLEGDAWPAFLTDGEGRVVTWTNGAYGRMVGGGGEEDEGEEEEVRAVDVAVVVVVVVVGEVELPRAPSFSCRVRLRYAGVRSMTAYCDVWRLRDGGMAWRVDSDAALSLRR